jgi:probable rRNA maturation factor
MLKAEWNSSPLSAAFQSKILHQVSSVLKKGGKVSVAFVSPKVMRRLNRVYRGKDKVTDVLSFPFFKKGLLGEILICSAQAERQAKKFGHSFEEEIAILLVHGFLHLFGFDHLGKKEAEKMFIQQKRILEKLNIDWRLAEYD